MKLVNRKTYLAYISSFTQTYTASRLQSLDLLFVKREWPEILLKILE